MAPFFIASIWRIWANYKQYKKPSPLFTVMVVTIDSIFALTAIIFSMPCWKELETYISLSRQQEMLPTSYNHGITSTDFADFLISASTFFCSLSIAMCRTVKQFRTSNLPINWTNICAKILLHILILQFEEKNNSNFLIGCACIFWSK